MEPTLFTVLEEITPSNLLFMEAELSLNKIGPTCAMQSWHPALPSLHAQSKQSLHSNVCSFNAQADNNSTMCGYLRANTLTAHTNHILSFSGKHLQACCSVQAVKTCLNAGDPNWNSSRCAFEVAMWANLIHQPELCTPRRRYYTLN